MTEIEIDDAVQGQAAEYAERLVAAFSAKIALNDMVDAGIPWSLAQAVLSMSDEEFDELDALDFERRCDVGAWTPLEEIDESDYSEPSLRFDDNG